MPGAEVEELVMKSGKFQKTVEDAIYDDLTRAAAAPQAPIIETFDRADGPLVAKWDEIHFTDRDGNEIPVTTFGGMYDQLPPPAKGGRVQINDAILDYTDVSFMVELQRAAKAWRKASKRSKKRQRKLSLVDTRRTAPAVHQRAIFRAVQADQEERTLHRAFYGLCDDYLNERFQGREGTTLDLDLTP